jgi:hypothetical protein
MFRRWARLLYSWFGCGLRLALADGFIRFRSMCVWDAERIRRNLWCSPCRPRGIQRRRNLVNMGPDHGPVDRGHNQDGKRTVSKPLLILHVLVAGEENVESFTLDQTQQLSILDAAPFHANHSMSFMPGQQPGKLLRYVLVE